MKARKQLQERAFVLLRLPAERRRAVRNFLIRAFDLELSAPRQWIALGVFLLALATAFGGSMNLGWLQADRYWINHFLFGIGMPMLWYSWTGSWRAALVATVILSFVNELGVDMADGVHTSVDWDHLAADLVGIALSHRPYQSLKTFVPHHTVIKVDTHVA